MSWPSSRRSSRRGAACARSRRVPLPGTERAGAAYPFMTKRNPAAPYGTEIDGGFRTSGSKYLSLNMPLPKSTGRSGQNAARVAYPAMPHEIAWGSERSTACPGQNASGSSCPPMHHRAARGSEKSTARLGRFALRSAYPVVPLSKSTARAAEHARQSAYPFMRLVAAEESPPQDRVMPRTFRPDRSSILHMRLDRRDDPPMLRSCNAARGPS